MRIKLFIGSSKENEEVANSIKRILNEDVDITLWTKCFEAGSYTLESLDEIASKVDFALFIFNPDDVTNIRTKSYDTTRDNVLFELGLFVGKIGKNRSLILLKKDLNNYHLPSDLSGITHLTYDSNRESISLALETPCYELKDKFKKYGIFNRSGEKSLPYSELGFDILSTLVIYNFGEMMDDNDTYEMNSLKVSSLRFLREGDFTIKTTRRSLGEILDAKSESHPNETTNTTIEEKIKGTTETKFHGMKVNQHEIYILESRRVLQLSQPVINEKFNDAVFTALCSLLITSRHKFCGTRIEYPTHNARLLIYFPKNYYPKRVEAYQIDTNGCIYKRRDIIIEQHHEKSVWIIECTNPVFSGGIYAIWEHIIK